jgi:transposase
MRSWRATSAAPRRCATRRRAASAARATAGRQLDFHGEELSQVDRDIALEAIDDPVVARLMTVPGIDVAVAISILAAVGDFSRFDSPDRLVSCLGLNPRVRQSGKGPAIHGRITKAGPARARGMLVEAAFTASRAPGPAAGGQS